VAVFEAGETQFTIRVPILTPPGKEEVARDE
jgi:solute carrier family 8 (sodium/calcium exchanger)